MRLVCGLMLLGFAVFVWALWPKSPRWRIPTEQVIGFDETKGLLYTKHYPTDIGGDYPSDWFEAHAYDLHSGKLRLRFRICSQEFQKQWDRWMGILSPDKSMLAVYSCVNGALEIFDLNAGKLLFVLRDSSFDRLDAIGFSQDGQFLAIRSLALVNLWDLRSGQMVHRLEVPRQGIVYAENVIRVVWHDDIQLSPDHRYLAVGAVHWPKGATTGNRRSIIEMN